MTEPSENPTPAAETQDLLAEYENVDTLISAAERVRDAGCSKWEACTPFLVHGLDKAMGHKHTKLPWLVMAGGTTGCLTGLLLCWWANATSFEGVPYALRGYEFATSGKPIFSLPANIPVIFELTILFSALTAFFALWAMNLLPRFHHPAFTSKRFTRVTDDRFFIYIDSSDEKFDATATAELLGEGSLGIEKLDVEEDES